MLFASLFLSQALSVSKPDAYMQFIKQASNSRKDLFPSSEELKFSKTHEMPKEKDKNWSLLEISLDF